MAETKIFTGEPIQGGGAIAVSPIEFAGVWHVQGKLQATTTATPGLPWAKDKITIIGASQNKGLAVLSPGDSVTFIDKATGETFLEISKADNSPEGLKNIRLQLEKAAEPIMRRVEAAVRDNEEEALGTLGFSAEQITSFRNYPPQVITTGLQKFHIVPSIYESYEPSASEVRVAELDRPLLVSDTLQKQVLEAAQYLRSLPQDGGHRVHRLDIASLRQGEKRKEAQKILGLGDEVVTATEGRAIQQAVLDLNKATGTHVWFQGGIEGAFHAVNYGKMPLPEGNPNLQNLPKAPADPAKLGEGR